MCRIQNTSIGGGLPLISRTSSTPAAMVPRAVLERVYSETGSTIFAALHGITMLAFQKCCGTGGLDTSSTVSEASSSNWLQRDECAYRRCCCTQSNGLTWSLRVFGTDVPCRSDDILRIETKYYERCLCIQSTSAGALASIRVA